VSDYIDAALAREHVELHIGHPDFVNDEEVPDAEDVVGRPVTDPAGRTLAASSGLGGAEGNPERAPTGESTHGASGTSATPSPVWMSQFGGHVYEAKP
jgi:hypothetical protein